MMNTVSIPNNIHTISEVFENRINNFPNTNEIKLTRSKAFQIFNDLGFPLKSNEEYKYSSSEKLFKNEFSWQEENINLKDIDFESYRNLNNQVAHIFLVNGRLIIEESNFSIFNNQITICDIKTAVQKYPDLISHYYGSNSDEFNDAFAQLNTALATNGLFIHVASNKNINIPIQINHICGSTYNSVINIHHIIVAEKFSQVNIIETFNSIHASKDYMLNMVAEVSVKENAFVNYYRLQNENDKAIHINATMVTQEAYSHFDTNTVTIGAKWLRNNLNIVLKGDQCETHLNGLQLIKGNQHVDNHTLVDHQMPHCESNQLYKGILKDKSTGVFNGKIFVRKDAQKTNAYQSSKNMLLSDDATMNTKPQLEIYADDVKCSHGSSTGQIDENALFYLRARGLSTANAKQLLMFAFAADVIQTIKIEPYKIYLQELIEKCIE